MPTLIEALSGRPLLDKTFASVARVRISPGAITSRSYIVRDGSPAPEPPRPPPRPRRSTWRPEEEPGEAYASDSSESDQESQRGSQGIRAQANLNVVPDEVEEWTTFWDDVKIPTVYHGVFNVDVPENSFETQNPYECRGYREPDALSSMKSGLLYPMSFVFDAGSSKFGFSKRCIRLEDEPGNASFSTDIGWTRNDEVTHDYPECFDDAPSPSAPLLRFILIHEHKGPIEFPFLNSTAEDRRDFIAAFKADHNGVSPTLWEQCDALSEALQTTAEEDLVRFYERARTHENWSDRRKLDAVSPILQIYVYMLRMSCKYGVLSTTDRTWFLELTPDNKLLISRPFHAVDTGADSVKYAYFSVLVTTLKGARLDLNEASLRKLGESAGLNITTTTWADVYISILALRPGFSQSTPRMPRGNGNDPAEGVAHDAGGATGASAKARPVRQQKPAPPPHPPPQQQQQPVTQTDIARAEALLRKVLPLPAEGFTYHGGLVDVVEEYRADEFGRTLRVRTRGVDTMIKVMRQPREHGVHGHYANNLVRKAKIKNAFESAMDAYEVLRPIQGKHVPWFLYGGPHILGDFILATTYEGRPLAEMPNNTLRATATKAKARAALDAVHALGVAHRAIDLRAFAMDDAGDVRLVDFLNSVADATKEELAADDAAFEEAFMNT